MRHAFWFVDSDTIITTVVAPQMLFVDGQPKIQARIGEPCWQQGWEWWSDVAECISGKKEALKCLSYFPFVIKVRIVLN